MNFKKFLSIFMVALLVVFTTSCVQPTPGNGGGDSSKYDFKTPQTDKLKLTEAWEGKDFINDGIGQVKLRQNVDGDTTLFTSSNGGKFTCRYLGIDTPESTYKVEQWGFAASNFTKDKLNAASTIVLQAEASKGRVDGNGRYLAWVWYRINDNDPLRLLNLEIVENAFSAAEASLTQYNDIFIEGEKTVKANKLRIWGEIDKTFDDSKVGVPYTIKQLRENFATLNVAEQNSYKGRVIRTTGVVTRQVGQGSAYLQSYDEATKTYYNIYVFGGYEESDLKLGRTVYVQGRIGYFNGALQISDLDRDNSGILELPDDPNNPTNIFVKDLTGEEYQNSTDALQGQLVRMTNLVVESARNSIGPDGRPNKGYTLNCKDENGVKIEIRVDKNSYIKIEGENSDIRIDDGNYFVGRTIKEITAVVGFFSNVNKEGTDYYPDGVQLQLLTGREISLLAK